MANKWWTLAEVLRAKDMIDKGYSDRQIESALGTSVKNARRVISRWLKPKEAKPVTKEQVVANLVPGPRQSKCQGLYKPEAWRPVRAGATDHQMYKSRGEI